MRPKTHRCIICGILILLCLVFIEVVNAKTHFILNATAGILRQAVKIAPNSEYTYSLLSWVYYKLNDTEEADAAFDQAHINSIKKAIQENPGDADAYFYLGQKYHHKGLFEQAIACYTKAKQLNSNHIWLWESLGEAYIDSEQYDKAIATYKEGIAILKNHPVWSADSKNVLNCYLGLEFAYTQLKRTEEAQICRKKALQLWPSAADYYFCFGNLFKKKGEWQNAIVLYKRSLEAEPNNIEIQNSLDTAYQEMNKQEGKAGPVEKTTFVLEEELRQLVEQVEQKRLRIEEEYAGEYAKFSAWAEKRISELDRAKELAYQEFQQHIEDIPVQGVTDDVNNTSTGTDTMASDANNGKSKFIDYRDSSGNIMVTKVVGKSAETYTLRLEQIKKEKEKIYKEFTRLRETRDRNLRVLEEYERNTKNRIMSEKHRVERLDQDESQDLGIIQSIAVGTPKGNRVMLGGEFYSEGDTVNGCRIISINEDGIKYAKGGGVYQQGLN